MRPGPITSHGGPAPSHGAVAPGQSSAGRSLERG
jgi:hypothetical protein